MAANASKSEVSRHLRNSLDYCNSHHVVSQDIFEEIVDKLITDETCPFDARSRSDEMKCLFPVLLQEQMSNYIPSITMHESDLLLAPERFLALWLEKWVSKYVVAWRSLPSTREARPKSAVTDPALIQMVMASGHADGEDNAYEWAAHHNLYMSAENIGGNLLEEYIAHKITPYGWIWCRGEILTAIDFCNRSCDVLFQVKNKTNTENSSGKGFRESRGAQVWHRMRANRFHGDIVTYWPQLVEIVAQGTLNHSVPSDLMCEEEYLEFVRTASEKNPGLITELEEPARIS